MGTELYFRAKNCINRNEPRKKPQIKFKLTVNGLGGNTSCNGFSNKITVDENKISITEPFVKTTIFCDISNSCRTHKVK